ncbi:unnamed protein product [Closterium sp. Naga37s-1]|nr:unnamed protein product [Closterium sp. Naga37s-1]
MKVEDTRAEPRADCSTGEMVGVWGSGMMGVPFLHPACQGVRESGLGIGWHQAQWASKGWLWPSTLQRDGSGPVHSQWDGSGPVRSQRDGSGPVRSQRDGSGPERSQRDGSGPVRSQRDGSGPVRSLRDGSCPVRFRRDGSGPVRSQRDGSGPVRSPRDGSAPSESPPSPAAPSRTLSVSPSAAAACDGQVLAQHRPSLHSLLDHSDELSAAALLLLEWHSLKTHGASFGESMYGLRRISTAPHCPSPSQAALRTEAAAGRAEGAGRGESATGGQEGGSASYGMSRKQGALSLLFLVLLPYLRAKLHALFAARQRQRQARALWVGGEGGTMGGGEQGRDGGNNAGLGQGDGDGYGDGYGYGGAMGGEERSESGSSSPGSMGSVGSLHGHEQLDDGLGTDGLRDETPGGEGVAGAAARVTDGRAEGGAGEEEADGQGGQVVTGGATAGNSDARGNVGRRSSAIGSSRSSGRGSRRWRQVVRVLRWVQRRAAGAQPLNQALSHAAELRGAAVAYPWAGLELCIHCKFCLRVLRGAAVAYPWLQVPYEGELCGADVGSTGGFMSCPPRLTTNLCELCLLLTFPSSLLSPPTLGPVSALRGGCHTPPHYQPLQALCLVLFLPFPPSNLFHPPTLPALSLPSHSTRPVSLYQLLPVSAVPAAIRDERHAFSPLPVSAVPAAIRHGWHRCLCLLYQLLYMMDATPHYSPILHLLSLSLRRATPQELAVQAALLKALYYTMDYAQTSVIAAVFAFKVAPAGIPVPADRSLCPLCLCLCIPVPSDRSLCPLCLCRRTNPTAPATSGFIFCYPCIFAYVDKVGCTSGFIFCYPFIFANVDKFGRCPITHHPTTVDQLRRLFPDA